jgi:hypothetical protein
MTVLDLLKYSNPVEAQKKAIEYLGKDALLYTSTNSKKKYSIYDPNKKRFVNFGAMGYEDFTLSKDDERRRRYLARATKIKGNWKDDKYSPNNLAINILW